MRDRCLYQSNHHKYLKNKDHYLQRNCCCRPKQREKQQTLPNYKRVKFTNTKKREVSEKMNAGQEAKLTMYRATEKHDDDNSTIIAAVPVFQTAFTNFKAKIASTTDTAQLKDVPLTGMVVDKSSSKQTLCEMTADIAGVIFAFASATGNQTLKQEVNFNLSKLLQTRDEQLAPRCQSIHARGIENKDALVDYGITPAKLAALQTAINNYAAETPKPRTALSQRKTLTSNLRQLFKDADAILTEQMDKLVSNFKAANPDFVATYETVRIIIDPATTATQLKGIVTDAANGNPIKNATVTIVELSKTTKTNFAGAYSFKPVANGTYTLTVTATGFDNFQADVVEVKLGVITSLDVMLS